MSVFLTTDAFPYCKGCGHHLVNRNLVRALEGLDLSPLDVVLVTDIGCHGIADKVFATHTVHGLHGRSVALGAGIGMGLPSGKKVVVLIGDGGATIGLQHLLEAARLNVDLTVVVHNNMLYGMTGGQPSGLTPEGFRTVITPEGSPFPHHDLCRLVLDAGAPYAARVVGLGDFSDALREAMSVEGFALVEVLEICVAYGVKRNPGLRLKDLAREAGYKTGVWRGPTRPAFRLPPAEEKPSPVDLEPIEPRFAAGLTGRIGVVLAGSAGEGVQRAAETFARAAISSGLDATKKGSYPVTVGVGFSTAELVLSHEPIAYHDIGMPDAVLVTSEDGLRHEADRIQQMDRGTVWVDESLPVPETEAEVRVRDFRGRAGPRNAAIVALLTFAHETGVIPPEAFVVAIRQSPIGKRVPEEALRVG